ncbi:MAG: glycosyltransferase [Chitinophagales bacterium]
MQQHTDISAIYWFAFYNPDSPAVRYRGQYPMRSFREKHGIRCFFVYPSYTPGAIGKFIRAYFLALFFPGPDSIIVIQRVRSRFIFGQLLRFLVMVRKKRTIYDLDDADYLDKPNTMIYHFLRSCDRLSAGSLEIESHFRQFNDKVLHISSPIVDLQIVKQKRNELFTIGWVGYFVTDHKKGLLEIIFPAIKALPFPCRFLLVGMRSAEERAMVSSIFEDAPHVQLDMPEMPTWRDEEAIQRLIVQFDAGVATLYDNPLQRAKSGIKVKQYMNNGIPTLSSDLPENNFVLVDGETGFFCSDAHLLQSVCGFCMIWFEFLVAGIFYKEAR